MKAIILIGGLTFAAGAVVIGVIAGVMLSVEVARAWTRADNDRP